MCRQESSSVCRSRRFYARLLEGKCLISIIYALSCIGLDTAAANIHDIDFLFSKLFTGPQTHLPGYVERADALKAEGADEIVCVSVNDPFVLSAWGKEHNASKVDFYS